MQSIRSVSPSNSWRTLLVILCNAIFFLPLGSQGQEAGKRVFDLPANTAEKTLKLYSQQSGRALIMSATAVRGIRTSPVHGEFTPREALDRVLANTGLEAVEDSESGSLAVRKQRNDEKEDGRAATKAASADRTGDFKKKTRSRHPKSKNR